MPPSNLSELCPDMRKTINRECKYTLRSYYRIQYYIKMSQNVIYSNVVLSQKYRKFATKLEAEMNCYRFTFMEEPGDERMAQIMREVAEDARQSTRLAAERMSAETKAAVHNARAKVEEIASRLRFDSNDLNDNRPVLIVIAGPNGSGKTSMTSKILNREWLDDMEYINPDNVARDVFGDWNNQDAVLKAANYCNEWRERCLTQHKSLIFETVMSASDKVEYILRAKQAGFLIRLFFISTDSPTINAGRVANRVLDGGHDVPIPKIISRYPKSIANCVALAPYVDRLYVYDNSFENAEARLLLRLSNGELTKRYVNDLPEWAISMLPMQ